MHFVALNKQQFYQLYDSEVINDALNDYRHHLTPYASELIEKHLNKSISKKMITFKTEERHFIIQFEKGNLHATTENLCDCKFYHNFGLPCAHILYVRYHKNINLFNIRLVNQRWTFQKWLDSVETSRIPLNKSIIGKTEINMAVEQLANSILNSHNQMEHLQNVFKMTNFVSKNIKYDIRKMFNIKDASIQTEHVLPKEQIEDLQITKEILELNESSDSDMSTDLSSLILRPPQNIRSKGRSKKSTLNVIGLQRRAQKPYERLEKSNKSLSYRQTPRTSLIPIQQRLEESYEYMSQNTALAFGDEGIWINSELYPLTKREETYIRLGENLNDNIINHLQVILKNQFSHVFGFFLYELIWNC